MRVFMIEKKIKTNSITYNHLYYSAEPKLRTFMKHSHAEFELLFFEKGEASYIIEGRKYQLNKNDLIFIHPFKYHYIEIMKDSDYQRINIAFAPSWLDSSIIDLVDNDVEIINCPNNSVIAQNFAKLTNYSEQFDDTQFETLLKCLITEILFNVNSRKKENVKESSILSPLLVDILNYINENLNTLSSINELCKQFYVAESYIFKLFKNQLKISPKKYINMKKLSQAQSMLQEGLHPTEIFHDCGFETYIGFYKQYKKIFGYPPSKENS